MSTGALKLDGQQRLVCLDIKGAMRTTPGEANIIQLGTHRAANYGKSAKLWYPAEEWKAEKDRSKICHIRIANLLLQDIRILIVIAV